MWAYRHYTLFSGTVGILGVLQTEGRPAKAARSFDNWELYNFPNPHKRVLIFPPPFPLLCVLKSYVRRPHCEGDKSFDMNHCVKVQGIQSSAQEEESLIAYFAAALLSSVLQIKYQLLRTAEHLSVVHADHECVFVCLCWDEPFVCVSTLVYCENKLVCGVSRSTDVHISCSWATRAGVLMNQWQTNFGLLAARHRRFCQGRIWSAVLCCFNLPTESHWGTCVCVCVCVVEMQGCMVPTLPWVVMHELLAKHCCCCCCLLC